MNSSARTAEKAALQQLHEHLVGLQIPLSLAQRGRGTTGAAGREAHWPHSECHAQGTGGSIFFFFLNVLQWLCWHNPNEKDIGMKTNMEKSRSGRNKIRKRSF